MAKINREQFLDNIQNIINEKLDLKEQVIDNTAKFGIRKYVVSLLESGQNNPRLMTYLNNYFRVLENKQAKEFTLFEQFGNGLTNFASGNLEVKKIINEMNETASNYGNELEAFMLIEQIQDPAAQEAVRDAYNNYLNCEDEKSCNLLIDAVDLVNQQQDPVGPQLTIIITNDSSSRLPKINYEDDLTISKFEEIQQKIRDEKNKKRLESIKDEVMNYANQVFDEAKAEEEAEKASCTFENIVNNNGIELAESIKNIASSDARSNKRLMETLDQYAGALTQGLYEERLFEGFVQNLSKYNYLLPVEKEIKRLNEVAKENANGILITKILEEMSVSPTSYWLMHIIEEDAARYVKYPNDMNKTQFKNVLVQYASDPYCNALIEALSKDNCALVETLDEKSLTVKDKIKLIREDANVSSIYSPVQYIKENECVFNANGQFYVKKGNTLAKLNPEYINQLREDFIALAQLVNDPHVKINEDSITLVGNDKVATIYEGYVDINGCRETTDTLRDLNEMCMKYDFDTNFFIMASCLHENYNKIAKVDFAKHISLNANEGINLDMFRLGNNIFINTVNEDIDKSTFYHNVNPLQCRNIINRHMGINVASLFEDLIPSQEKILLKLNETKEEYEASIDKYENMISRLKKAKDECVSVDNEEKLDTAIESAETKLDELKKEYKQWQKDVKDNTDKVDDDKEENQDDNTEVEEPNKPIDAKEVDDVKDELAQPLDNDEASAENEEDPTITDDEFDSYLNADEEGEESAFVEEPESQEVSSEEGEDEMQLNTANTEEEPVEEPTTEEEPNDELNGFAEVNIDEPTAEEPVEEPTTDECPEGECQTEPEVEPAEEIGEPTPEEPVEDELTTEGYKIANISFDRNVKTGEIFRTGTVIVVCPKVDASGRMYVDSNTYKFYINDETNLPVVDAADVPVALYNAITAAIIDEEGYENAISAGVSANDTVEQPENFFLPADEVSSVSDELEKNDEDDFFEYNDDEDSFTITPKEDETSDVIIPTYKSEDGKTDIELPAPQADGTAIPEELPKEEEEKTEEVKPAPAKPVHESRNLIVGISSQFKKNGKDFFLNEGTSKPSKKEEDPVNEGWEEAAGKIAKEVGTKILKDVGPKIADMVAKKAGEIITNKVDNALNGKNDQQQQQPVQPQQQQPVQPAQPTQPAAQQQQQQQTTESLNSINEEDANANANDANNTSTNDSQKSEASGIIGTGISTVGSALGVRTLTDNDAQALIKELFTNPEYREQIMDTIVQTAEAIPQFTAIVKLVKAIIKQVKDGKPGMDPKEMLKDMQTKPSEQAKGMLNNMSLVLEILKKVFINDPKQLLNAAKIIGGLTGDGAAGAGEAATVGIATVILAPIQVGSTKMMVKAAINLAAAFVKAFLQYVKENPLQQQQQNSQQQAQTQQQQQAQAQQQQPAQPAQQQAQPQQTQSNESVNTNNTASNVSEEVMYEPYEDYSEETDMDEFGVLHTRVEKALVAYPEVQVSDIENLINFIPYFKIEEVNGQGGYVCYMIGNMILYRSIEEFDNILKDVEIYDGPVQEQKLLYALVHDYEDPEIEKDYVKRDSLEDIKNLAYTLTTYFKSQYDTNELLENIKIRRPKLSSGGDVEKSKLADDALHGDKERRDFEDKVEQETQKAGVDNPLAPSAQPQEEHVQILPNVHNPVNEEAKAKLEGNNITYEPMDKVIIKETNETPEMRAQVMDVVTNEKDEVVMLTVLASNGITYDVEPKEIEPDPLYLENIPGRQVNSQKLDMPRLAVADKDLVTGETKYPEDLADHNYADLNGRTTPVYIVVEGMRLTSTPCSAFTEDIKNSKKMIRVINEDGDIQEYDAEKNLEFEEMPYAVVVNDEGKPVRAIRIDPMSYINAGEEDLVDCTVADKPTKYPKKVIDVLS